jgi:hypothetical protein
MALMQQQQLAEGNGLTGDWIRWPPGPQRLYAFPHQPLPLQRGIPGCHEHWASPHLSEQQSPFQQRGWNHGVIIRQSDGTVFEKIAVGGEFIRLAAAAEASPKVQTNRCCLILLEAESLEPLRTIAPAAAAGKQANLAIASCGGTVAQAYGCFLIATEGGFKDGMRIHQAGGDQLIRCCTGLDAQAQGLLPGFVVKSDEHPLVDQDCTELH